MRKVCQGSGTEIQGTGSLFCRKIGPPICSPICWGIFADLGGGGVGVAGRAPVLCTTRWGIACPHPGDEGDIAGGDGRATKDRGQRWPEASLLGSSKVTAAACSISHPREGRRAVPW